MKPLSVIYWSRVCFAILAAVICVILNFQDLITNISMSVIIFFLSYYLYRWLFAGKIKKTSKYFTTGIGAYFITWFAVYVLLYNLIYSPLG